MIHSPEDALYRKLEYEDYYGCIESYFRYLELKPSEELRSFRTLHALYRTFRNTGYYEEAEEFAHTILSLNNDTARYLGNLVNLNNWKGDYEKAIEYALERWAMDTTSRYAATQLLNNYTYLEDTVNAVKSLRRLRDTFRAQ